MNLSPLRYVLLLTLLAIATSCGKKTDGGGASDKFGTNKLNEAFSSAPASQKSVVQNAETSISGKDYGRAYDALQNLSRDTTLTPEQTQAINGSLLELGKYPRLAP